ncbi:MAG: lytic murein transglycosylase [Methylophaga sp.]|nr:MAG: lytic murein transglycosylase [Methylophaga sp.]
MRNFIIGLLLTLVGIMGLMLLPSKQEPAAMPWEVTVMGDGNSKVLGIHLGTTTFRQAQLMLHAYGKTAVFIQENETPTVEAFFESINLGGLSAKIVLNMSLDQRQVELMLERATEARLQPSGAHRYDLNPQDHASLLDTPISALTYIPSIKLNKARIEHRFGKPDQIKPDPESPDTTIWQYTAIGLNIRINPTERSVLQYRSSH